MDMDLTESSKQLRSLRPGSIQLLYTHRCQWTGCSNVSCRLCRQTRQRCFSYICNSQVVKSNRVNDQNKAETCLLKADCGDCVAITAIALTAAKAQDLPMTHLQLSLIEESDAVKAILDSQSEQVRPRTLVDDLMRHSIATKNILKAHLTAGAFHQDGQLLVPIDNLQHGYGLQGREVSALPLRVYIDCLLKEIRNVNDEAVKSVHLLAVAASITDDGSKQVLDHVIPALSSPFTLFTRRRDIKSPFPRMSDPVTEVSDIADATARKLQNLRVNATNADAGMLAILPDTPIETVGQLHKFISPLDDEALVHISRLVLRRPADCLTKLKRHLKERMITQDNDTTPRVWNPASSTGLGLLYCASEGAVNLQYTASNPSVMLHGQAYQQDNEEAYRTMLHQQAVVDWHRCGHNSTWSLLGEQEQQEQPSSSMSQFSGGLENWQADLGAPAASPAADMDNLLSDLLPNSASYQSSSLPGHVTFDSGAQLHQPEHHRDYPTTDRSWSGGGANENPFAAKEMLIAPMTDSFVQILHQIAEPAATDNAANQAWQDDLGRTFHRSMKLDEEGLDSQALGCRQSVPLPLDVSMSASSAQPLTWSFASVEMLEGRSSNPMDPTSHIAHLWLQHSDVHPSGGTLEVTNSLCMGDELESPFDSYCPPDQH